MSNRQTGQMLAEKTEDLWPIACLLSVKTVSCGMWETEQWQLDGFSLHPEGSGEPVALLKIYRDERTDYRFNLSSQDPRLFLILENNGQMYPPPIVHLTASQSVAARYMDSDYVVLSSSMPLPVQAWMEAFIGRHGELLETKGKKRAGAGRASGN